jgi:hypothetical protein
VQTSRPPSSSPALLRFLTVLASGALGLAVVCAWGWYRARTERVSVDALSPEDRQALVEQMLAVSPGAFAPALFEPAVGFTLKPGQRIEEWGDAFTANEIGYRTWPLKRGGRRSFRVVFLGDSWTFGLGVSGEESFPRQVEALANGLGAAKGQVVAFNLGLPGYNTLNEVAALEFFYDRLQPDAVVICPTPNDADSSGNVLPNGSLTHAGVERDGFGDPSTAFRLRVADSFKLRNRWRKAFGEIRRLEERLNERGVPLVVHFTATWDEPFAHALMRDSGVKAPYLVTPPALTEGRFRNRHPWRHGTAEANRLYAHMVYRALAQKLGWPPPPPVEEKLAEAPVYRQPPAEDPELRELLHRESRRIPERYEPGPAAQIQCQSQGLMSCETGLMGKAALIWVRRRPGAGRIAVTLRRLENAPSLYPLPVEVSIPSPGGGTQKTVAVPAAGSESHRIVLDIPVDLPAGAVLDVTLRAARTASAPRLVAPRSLFVAGIEQE